jgi:hypothetical protein
MAGFSTQVSVLPTAAGISRRLAMCGKGNVFVADDNHGAVPVGDRGQIAVTVAWTSPSSLIVSYPDGARVFQWDSSAFGIKIEYGATRRGF